MLFFFTWRMQRVIRLCVSEFEGKSMFLVRRDELLEMIRVGDKLQFTLYTENGDSFRNGSIEMKGIRLKEYQFTNETEEKALELSEGQNKDWNEMRTICQNGDISALKKMVIHDDKPLLSLSSV